MDPIEDRKDLGINDAAPSEPGSYVLIMHLDQPTAITVGKLGTFEFAAGWYAYAGSALGQGGLAARLAYHQRREKSYHWHIDYLSEHLAPDEVWYTNDPTHREHHWSEVLSHTAGASIPLPGFGSSDCRCISHLYFFSSRPSINYYRRKIHAGVDGHARIFTEKFLAIN